MFKTQRTKTLRQILVVMIFIGISIPCFVALFKQLAILSGHNINQFFTPEKATCSINSIFNSDLQEKIQNFVKAKTDNQSLLGFNPDIFYKELKQKFPVIKELEWNYVIPKTLELTIKGTYPYCMVNQIFVLGNKRNLFTKELFAHSNLNELPNVWVDEQWINKKINKSVYDFLHKIPSNMWSTYSILYHAPDNIELIPHTSICGCHIITDEKSFFEQRKFNALSPLFRDMCKRGFITTQVLNAKKIPFGFDFRIKNQIIVKFYEPIRRGKGI